MTSLFPFNLKGQTISHSTFAHLFGYQAPTPKYSSTLNTVEAINNSSLTRSSSIDQYHHTYHSKHLPETRPGRIRAESSSIRHLSSRSIREYHPTKLKGPLGPPQNQLRSNQSWIHSVFLCTGQITLTQARSRGDNGSSSSPLKTQISIRTKRDIVQRILQRTQT